MITFFKRLAVLLLVATFWNSVQAAPVFPVKYSPNSRYLVDQNNVPFPILGRTAWFITSLSVADYRMFIDDTAARGYNAIELHVLNHDPRGNNPPFGGTGALPFLTRLNGTAWNGALTYGNINNEAPNLTTPNEPFWSHVDGLLAYAESKGMLVFMFPAYVGYAGGNQGWMQELVANGSTRVQSYGAWLATRYRNQKNLVWMMGGDMGTSPHAFNSAQTSVESALLNGLKSVSGQQSVLFSAEWDSQSIATDQTSFGTAMTLNGAYSWTGDVNYQGRRAYAYSSVRPAFLLEEPYDEEGSDGNGVNPSATQPVRRFQWWGWLSTIGGYISGNGYIWPFPSTWKNHLNTQGSRDMGRLNGFIGSIAWQNLVPSGLNGMRTLVTSGGSSVSAADYVAAAAAPDGTLLVAYIPPAHNGAISIDMAAMSGLARARWFDPTSAIYTDIGTGLANTGTRSFTPPGNNSVGQKDWVLVLDRASGAAAPTISNIADQSTTASTPTPAIAFTINDAQTPAGSLTLGKGSSNPTLVPTNSIVYGGSGSNRTVTVTPAGSQTGTATITVSVSDGTNSASDTFVLTVNAVNTPPTITGIGNQTINEDASTAALNFTIGDAQTAAASLTLSKGSSNPTLVPSNNIVFGGSGASRTVTVSPAANQSGTATITVSVSDGQFTVSTNYLLTVSAVNDAPSVSAIANQTIISNGTAGPLSFTIGDAETAAGSLTLSKSSSNPALVPAGNIVIGGSGASRTVTVTPAASQTGTATIGLSVSDGALSASNSFVLTVIAGAPAAVVRVNAGGGAFTDNAGGLWSADTGFNTGTANVVTTPINNTVNDALYQSERWDATTSPELAYSFNLANGDYLVNLHFAETYPGASSTGARVFDVLLEGQLRIDNLDIYSQAGSNTALIVNLPVTVADGQLNISFVHGIQNPKICAIEVMATAASPVVPPSPAQITSVTLDAGGVVQVTAEAAAGASYALEASSDLTSWTQVDVQNNASGSVVFTEPPTTNSIRFYRVLSIPQ